MNPDDAPREHFSNLADPPWSIVAGGQVLGTGNTGTDAWRAVLATAETERDALRARAEAAEAALATARAEGAAAERAAVVRMLDKYRDHAERLGLADESVVLAEVLEVIDAEAHLNQPEGA
jgi:hypothetical protein